MNSINSTDRFFDVDVIDQLDRSVGALHTLFELCEFDSEGKQPKCWPYWLVDDLQSVDSSVGVTLQQNNAWPKTGISQSTNAMIVATILSNELKLNERYSTSHRWGRTYTKSDAKISDTLFTRLELTILQLLNAWEKHGKKKREKGKSEEPVGCVSQTYGVNDLLTLSWYLDIAKCVHESRDPRFSKYRKRFDVIKSQIVYIIKTRASSLKSSPTDYAAICCVLHADDPESNNLVGNSAYLLLRFCRVLVKMELELNEFNLFQGVVGQISRLFSSRLHEHLSFSEITDSRFDPSELAFCLEGILLTRPELINPQLASRVFHVLERAQKSTPYWRTETPMVVTQKGQLLFPISVEAAASLIYSLSIFEEKQSGKVNGYSLPQNFVPALVRYWNWLRARRLSLAHNGQMLSGWHSQHVANPIVHTWETSQVIEFLVGLHDRLRLNVSERLLEEVSVTTGVLVKQEADWDKVLEKFEPALDLPSEFHTYDQIKNEFVTPIRNGEFRFRSMMIYGPPGTGKTSLAKQFAAELGYPFIYLTVSDFLSGGEAKMEKRAKKIFEALMQQPTSVVFFDEFDQFILDRESEKYEKQETVFQFLTPGMLTKFADLYESKSVFFMMATNYEERIDLAISRPGRIDKKYLVLPPSKSRRRSIIKIIILDMHNNINVDDENIELMARASIFLGYKDILNVLKNVDSGNFSKKPNSKKFRGIIEEFKKAPRSIQFDSYVARIESSKRAFDVNSGMVQELRYLFHMAVEAYGIEKSDWEREIPSFRKAMIELFKDSDWFKRSENSRDFFKSVRPDIHSDLQVLMEN